VRQGTFDHLFNIPLHALTSDTIAANEREVASARAEKSTLTSTSSEALWAQELVAFRNAVAPLLETVGAPCPASLGCQAIVIFSVHARSCMHIDVHDPFLAITNTCMRMVFILPDLVPFPRACPHL
jgi:hypothetical protein